VKNLYLIILLFSISILNGCGGDSDSSTEGESPEISQAQSELAFYLPSWFDHNGEIIIRSKNGDVITSIDTLSLNKELITINANQVISIEYIPVSKKSTCPVTIGCGNSYDYYHEDSNSNGIIDYNEVFSMNNIFAAQVLLSPGTNTIYFSLISLIESSSQVNSHLKSLSVTPNYHQTYVNKEHNQGYQYLANGSYHSLFSASSSTDAMTKIKASLTSFVQENTLSEITTDYFTSIDQYLSEQKINNNDVQLNKYLVEEKFKLGRLLANSEKNPTLEHSSDLNDRILLEQFRNILAFINIQELKYNGEVNDKVSALSNVFTDDSEKTTAIFSEVIAEILHLYSPINDTPAGLYHYEGLDINYRGSPYTWIISGIYKEAEVNLELIIPQWRISAARGDFIEATIAGNVNSENSTLTINTNELFLKFDGVDDVFNEEKAKTATFKLMTTISISTEHGEINGLINIEAARVKNELGQLFSILNQFSFLGMFTTEQHTTNISIMAIKHTESLAQNENDFIYDILLDLPSSGSSDFRLAISGLNTDFEQLDNVNLALRMQGHVLELNLKQDKNIKNITVKGLDGRWLTLNKNNKDYSGNLYFGDIVIGEVITVRGLPGVLFPNGDFHSIF
jgi:hypothetical protein